MDDSGRTLSVYEGYERPERSTRLRKQFTKRLRVYKHENHFTCFTSLSTQRVRVPCGSLRRRMWKFLLWRHSRLNTRGTIWFLAGRDAHHAPSSKQSLTESKVKSPLAEDGWLSAWAYKTCLFSQVSCFTGHAPGFWPVFTMVSFNFGTIACVHSLIVTMNMMVCFDESCREFSCTRVCNC